MLCYVTRTCRNSLLFIIIAGPRRSCDAPETQTGSAVFPVDFDWMRARSRSHSRARTHTHTQHNTCLHVATCGIVTFYLDDRVFTILCNWHWNLMKWRRQHITWSLQTLTTASRFLLVNPALTQLSSQRWWFGSGWYRKDKRVSVKIWFSAAWTASSHFAHFTTQTWPWVPAGTPPLLAWASSPWLKETSASGEEPSDPSVHTHRSPSLPTGWHFLWAVVGRGDTVEAFSLLPHTNMPGV